MGSGTSKPSQDTKKEQYKPTADNALISPRDTKVLSCTVLDTKSNNKLNFVSSVKGSTEEQPRVAKPGGTSSAFVFGDVTLVDNPDTSSTNRSASSVDGAVQQGANEPIINIGDAYFSSAQFFPSAVQLEKMTTAELFAARTLYATPINYSLTTCGGQPGPVRCISTSPDGQQFAVVVAGNKQCFLVDAVTGKTLMSIRGHIDPILSCCYSRDSKFLVTSSADCTVVLWDLNNAKKLREVPVSFQANVCAVNDESDTIATTSTEDFVNLWEAKSCDPLITFQRHTHSIFSLSFSRRAQLIASGSTNGEIYVWQYLTGDVRFLFNKHHTAVLAVSFSHDGQRLVSVDRESLRVWDLFTGHCVLCRDTRGKVIPGTEDFDTGGKDENVRFTTCAFVAGNLILTATTAKVIMLLEPNCATEMLVLPTKGVVTSVSPSWAGDIIFIGDFLGNHYRLELQFATRDIKTFNLNSKPIAKDKGKLDKD